MRYVAVVRGYDGWRNQQLGPAFTERVGDDRPASVCVCGFPRKAGIPPPVLLSQMTNPLSLIMN